LTLLATGWAVALAISGGALLGWFFPGTSSAP